MQATPDGKIKSIAGGMDTTQRSNTMKYVYKAMDISEAPISLLKWHAELRALVRLGERGLGDAGGPVCPSWAFVGTGN